jgi:hypothetical protein
LKIKLMNRERERERERETDRQTDRWKEKGEKWLIVLPKLSLATFIFILSF